MAPLFVSSPPATLSPYDRTQGNTGIYAPSSPIYGTSQTTPSANRAYFMRFVPSRNMSITKIAFALVVAAGANDALDIGVYDASLNRLASKGATTGILNASPGVQEVALGTTLALTGGTVYYAAWSSGTQGGTAPQIVFVNYSASFATGLMGQTAGVFELGFQAAAHPLPATSTAALGIAAGPLLAVRES